MDDAFELIILSPTDLTHLPQENIWDTVARPGTLIQAATHTTATLIVTHIATATTVVPTAIRTETPTVVTAVIGAIVVALPAVVVTHLITGGVGATPGVLLEVAALARIMMVLQPLVQRQAPLTRLRTVVVGEGSAVSGYCFSISRCASRGPFVSVIDRRKHGQEVSFVQAQVIEEVHGGHPAANLKLAMFSLLPYLEESKTWFSRSLFQTENQVQNFILDYLPVSVPLFHIALLLCSTLSTVSFHEEWQVTNLRLQEKVRHKNRARGRSAYAVNGVTLPVWKPSNEVERQLRLTHLEGHVLTLMITLSGGLACMVLSIKPQAISQCIYLKRVMNLALMSGISRTRRGEISRHYAGFELLSTTERIACADTGDRGHMAIVRLCSTAVTKGTAVISST